MHKGNATLRFKDIFGTEVLKGNGVRWWIKWEQIAQLDQFGIEKFMKEVVDWCMENKFSEESAKALVAFMNDPVNRARVLIEAAAHASAGLLFCIVTYLLEGDKPLIFVAYRELEKIDIALRTGIPLERVNVIAPRCAELVKDALVAVDAALTEELNKLAAAQEALSAKTVTYNTLVAKAETMNAANANNGNVNGKRKRKRTSQAAELAAAEEEKKKKIAKKLNEAINEAKTEIKSAAKEEALAEKGVEDARTARTERLAVVGPRTLQDFKDYAESCVKVGYDYYENRFNGIPTKSTSGKKWVSGELTAFKKATWACQVFDPDILAHEHISSLELRIDALVNFGFLQFSPDFLSGMKKELPLAIEHAKRSFDWSTLKGAKEYDIGLERRDERHKYQQERKAQLNKDAVIDSEKDAPTPPPTPKREIKFKTWREDPGERGRRIWEWWVLRVKKQTTFYFFKKAVRLVVLVQVSSACVERVFSQLVQIMNACGSGLLRDALQFRLFRLINKDLYKNK